MKLRSQLLSRSLVRGIVAVCAAVGTLTEPPGVSAQATAPFTKITTGDLVTTPANYWIGSWGDYDDDGYLDLFVGATSASKTNFLYHNNRDGTFTLIDAASMPKVDSNQHGEAWGDYDNDGHLDLIVTAGNPGVLHNVLYHNNGDGTFAPVTTGPIFTQTSQNGFHSSSWGDYDNDGFLDLFIAGHSAQNRLFHNNGDGSFTRIVPQDPGVGVLVSDVSYSNGSAWVDYDNDGAIDLFVSNFSLVPAPSNPNVLYRSNGNGVFTKVTDSGLTDRFDNSFGICWADYDNDGFLDLFLANAQKNSLYHNNGDGTFTGIADSAVVSDTILPEAIFGSCAWGDYDNDGFIDLFVTAADCPLASPGCVQQGLHNFLYHNNGDGSFTPVTDGSVVTDLTIESLGVWGDYDNDGFLDLFVSQGGFAPDPQTNLLYHNDGNSNGWLTVKLIGTVSNRSAIGAKIRVNAFYRGASRWQLRTIGGGGGYGASNQQNAEFGLAEATTIDTVRIEWPSGAVQELQNVAPRQFLTVTEPLCTGDCDGGGQSTVDELLTLVNIALGSAPRSACPRGVSSGAQVDIALIIQAVNNALSSCPSSDLYVAAAGALNGDGSVANPYRRITDAVVRARAERQSGGIPPQEEIRIHVAPGTYIGSFGRSALQEHPEYEVLPIILNVPKLAVRGATVLVRDDGALPTGTESGSETIVEPDHPLQNHQSLFLVTPTADGAVGNGVTVEGLVLDGREGSGFTSIPLFVDRVSDFRVSNNVIQHGSYGVTTRLASGTIEGNLLTHNNESGTAVTGGSIAHPATVFLHANRVTGNGQHGFQIGAVGNTIVLLGGSNTLELQPLQTNFDRSKPEDVQNIPDTLAATLSGNDISDYDVFGIRLLAVGPEGSGFFCIGRMGYETHDDTQPLTAVLTATVLGNTFTGNGLWGLGMSPGFPCRNDLRALVVTFAGSFEGNSFVGSERPAALFTFTGWGASITPSELQTYGFTRQSTYQVTDVDGELVGFDYDNPVTDPVSGAVLNNTLTVNGVEVPHGVSVTPQAASLEK